MLAVIADGQTAPEDYLNIRGDVVLMDGQVFANPNNFWSGPFVEPDIDQFGNPINRTASDRAWTGVLSQCYDSTPWNSAQSSKLGMTGSLAGQGTSAWLGDNTHHCDVQWHVYCISNQD